MRLFKFHKRRNFFSLLKTTGYISPCITLPCPFQKKTFLFLSFWPIREYNGTYLQKNFLICFSPLSPQSRKRMMNTLLLISRCMKVRPLLRPKTLYYAQNTHPISSKFHLSKWKTYFSQIVDKFFKIEDLEYLIHYVKFYMWPALFYVNFLCFPLNF